MRSMLKHHADALVVALAITPRDEDLDAHGKAHRQGGEDEIIQARHHGGTQLVGAEVTEESGVGEGDNGLRQVTQHDGVCNAPDFAVGDCRSSHKNQENAHQKNLIISNLTSPKVQCSKSDKVAEQLLMLALNDLIHNRLYEKGLYLSAWRVVFGSSPFLPMTIQSTRPQMVFLLGNALFHIR